MSSRLSVVALPRRIPTARTVDESIPSDTRGLELPDLCPAPKDSVLTPAHPVQSAIDKPTQLWRNVARGGAPEGNNLVSLVSDRLARDLMPAPNDMVQVGVAEMEQARRTGQLTTSRGGVGLAPALQVQVYRPDNDVVRDDPLRNWFKGVNAAWVDTTGVFETRKYAGLAVPLGDACVTVGAGFDASALVQYRAVLPYDLSVQSVEKLMQWNQLCIPDTVEEARNMPVGGEFAMRGSGAVAGSANITGGPLGSLGALSAGAGARVGGLVKARGDFELDVLRLEGDKVRVTLRRSTVNSRALGAELLAGVAEARNAIPSWGEGALLRLIQASGARALLDVVRKFGAIRAFCGMEDGCEKDHEAHFEFDLSVPDAARAYESVFSLDFASAEQLAMVQQYGKRSGVVASSTVTTSQYNTASTLVNLLGAKILLNQTLHLESQGARADVQGNKLLTRRSLLRKTYQDIARGRVTLNWQVLQARREDAQYEPYFQLSYHHVNKITLPKQVETLFRFADALGESRARSQLQTAQASLAELSKQSWAKKLFSAEDNTETDMELYFTSGGIKTIAKAQKCEVFTAYVAAVGKLEATMERTPLLNAPDLATPLLAKMAEFNRAWWWTTTQACQVRALKAAYEDMFGRDIAADMALYDNAMRVADAITKMRDVLANGDEEARGKAVSNFFIEIGKRHGYQFSAVLATLAHLAGEHGTLVHRLKLQGAGIEFAADESPAPSPLLHLGRALTRRWTDA